ncbi:MAG: hypothetical protein KatS3mg105_1461 [Gemmatales bacterium]|nr:MAG: hypothetical protein KatS3mg105_1461 [Gemmatales bacterium]
MAFRCRALVTLCFLLMSVVGLAQEGKGPKADGKKSTAEIPAGHSQHGEAFNEGPRQKAYLMGGTGNVDFPISTKVPLAQKFFNQGIGQLHGFWYYEAERSFRMVADLDPDCAMAYWGLAMANFDNQKRASEFIKKAVALKGKSTRREQLYIDGLAAYILAKTKGNAQKRQYLRSLESVIHEYPDDIEAKAFLVVRLWQFSSALPLPSYQAVDALLDQVFDKNPKHPAHHYRIHLWDYEKPIRALRSAAQCGQSAPAIAHMWHMAGHTFSRLKRYPDGAWQQEASSRADHAYMIRDRLLPDQIANYAHNQEWLIRNLIHIGRAKHAVSMAKNLIELPRHPKYNNFPKQRRSATYGRMRLFLALEKFELWEELIRLCHTAYLEPTDDDNEQVKRLVALGTAYGNLGDQNNLKTLIAELDSRLQKEQAKPKEEDKKTPNTPAGKKDTGNKKPARPPAKPGAQGKSKPNAAKIRQLKTALDTLRGYEALCQNDVKKALGFFNKVQGFDKMTLSRLYLKAGDRNKAEQLATQAANAGQNEVLPLANLAYVLDQAGKKKEAAEAFQKLRNISGHIDSLAYRPFQRLAPLAKSLGLPDDWRLPAKWATDVGDRPPLDSIGPLRWHPFAAPSWTLPASSSKVVSLNDYRGRPVIVIFYLGYGCLHCVEQLLAFAPRTKDFQDAGIELVAISTDSLEDLTKSQARYKGPFPFPLVADPKLEVFKAYRAFDDFEETPLHGTFLIDGAGRVRWHDISYEPFQDVDFLLKESKRLLSLPVPADE